MLSSFKWLAQLGPGFAVSGSTIRVLPDPETFYNVLLDKTRLASKRVSLASLYIGNGLLEKRLLEALQDNLLKNQQLKVNVLLDCSRGSRGQDNSRTLLVPLLRSSDSCQVFLYHTPALRGLVKKWLPQRWDEVVGLQHMKIYIFDDSLLITGANLSHDYFTNRQDRYILVEDCKDLTDFYDGLIERVSTFSLQLNKENQLNLSKNWTIHPSTGNKEEFINKAKNCITSYYNTNQIDNKIKLQSFLSDGDTPSQNESKKNSSLDTWLFPMIQMGPLDIGLDNYATNKIFEEVVKGSSIKLATGYFNLTGAYIEKIVDTSAANFDILMAHPKANGFLGAKGVAGGIPAGYTLIAKMFHQRVKDANQQKRIAMWEYLRPNWTFHAKGLWLYPSRMELPIVTLIGSPNFGHRSVDRDLETQLYIVTKHLPLQTQLHEEQRRLFEYSKCFSDKAIAQPDRLVPLWVRLVIKIFRNFF